MKKFFGFMVMMAMLVSAAMAELMDHTNIFDRVWISENFYYKTVDEEYVNIVGDSMYIYGPDMVLGSEYNGLSDKEVMDRLTKDSIDEGFENPAVWCRTSEDGKVVVIYIYSENNIRMIDGLKYYFNEHDVEENVEIHNFNVLCWRDWSSME